MSNQPEIELIERYLGNQLNTAERLSFEARMAADKDLYARVELQRMIQTELANADQMRLLDALHGIVQEPFEEGRAGSGKTGWWVSGLLLVLVAGYFGYINFYAPVALPAPPPVQAPQPAEKILRPTPEPQKDDAKIETTEPIAALNRADFQINRTLEPLVGSQVRGGGPVEVKFTRPAAPLYLKAQNGKVNFRVEGTVYADDALNNNALQFLLFNNREADFLKNKPLYKLPVSLKQEKDQYRFSQKVEQNLKPGLYYLMAVEKDSNEPLAVLKITVNPN